MGFFFYLLEMGSSSSSSWLLDYGLADEISATDFIWAPHNHNDSAMLGSDAPCREDSGSDNSCSRKRNRIESCAASGTKACKEKLRRDKLNDRFTELCSILDPGRPPKADKVGILSDAIRRLNQLRLEAQKLKDSNDTLQDSIKSLKAEKHELRDEKVALKAEKERLEQVVKCTSPAPPFMAHPAAAIAAFHSTYKAVPYPNYLPAGMWQWIPPVVLDTSQDHVLRPPVA